MAPLILMIAKDLRVLLGRSPGTLMALIGYPLLVALLVALVLSGSERQPRIAVVNLDDSGRTAEVGGQRVDINDYIDRITDDADVVLLDDGEAQDALQSGRVSAVLRIPDGFIGELQTSIAEPPRLELQTSRRDPLEAQEIQRRVEAALFRESEALSSEYIAQVRRLVDILTEGGTIEVFGRSGTALGLDATTATLEDVAARLRAIGEPELAERLTPLARFVDQASRNLDRAGRVAESIGSPIALDVQTEGGPVEPISGFGLAAALTLAIGLVAALLGAALLGAERDDDTLGRLLRGPLGVTRLVAAKIIAAAAPAAAVGLVSLVAIALLTNITVDRWHLWPLALVLAALLFAAIGVALGSLARDGRSALLITLMVVVPVIFLGVVPLDGLADRVLSMVGAGLVFENFRTLLVEPQIDGALAIGLGAVALSVPLLGALAAWGVARREAY